MADPLPVPALLDEWFRWAAWQTSEDRDESLSGDLIGHSEFTWVAEEHPEHCWAAILAALRDPRQDPYLGILAAGPLEDLLSYHGPDFIDRVEAEAQGNAKFARVLGGVWQFKMSDDIWTRVQAVWDPRGWDGNARQGGHSESGHDA